MWFNKKLCRIAHLFLQFSVILESNLDKHLLKSMKHFNIFLLSVFVAFASCSFTTKTFDNPDKDKLLMQLVTYLLEQGHFQPKDFNDELRGIKNDK